MAKSQKAQERHWRHCELIMLITKGSSRGATLSFTLRSKGEGGQPRYLILQEIASHFSTPPPPPPPPHLPRTLRADSKHCNLQYFCSFRIKKPHFATWWNLRKYQCFCQVLAKKHCKYRAFYYQRQKNIVNTVVLGFRPAKNIGIYGVFSSESCKNTRKHHRFDDFQPLRNRAKTLQG